MALTTITAYKTYAGITGSGDDTVLQVLLDAAVAQVRRACGRDLDTGFEKATRTETLDGSGGQTVQLAEWPVSSITSVSLIDDSGDTTALASTDYRVNTKNGILFRVGSQYGWYPSDVWGPMTGAEYGDAPRWPEGFQNISVVYSGGYDVGAGDVPDDLLLAVYRLVDIAFAQRRADPTKQSESIGDYSYTMKASAESDSSFLSLVHPFKTLVP